MWISSINLNNFRCFKSLPLTASKDLNILVGENNVGKTSVFIAVSKLISLIWERKGQAFQTGDIRRSRLAANPLSVSCSFSLDANERRDIINLLSPKDFDLTTKRILSRRLGNTLDTLQVGFEWSETSQDSYIKLGPLYVNENTFSHERYPSGQTLKIDTLIRSLVSPEYSQSFDVAIRGAEVWEAANLKSKLLKILLPRLSHFEEFRGRPGRTGRTAALNSLEGSQTANVLLNLKNHTERRQRDRYIGVTHAFSTFFPRLRIEAVETEPSSGIADIHFTEIGDNYPVPIENVGAGISELLTLLTNLVTLRGYIFVIEEPELHLHPHAKRNLADLIRRSSTKNQFFIITHDPLFIYPDFIHNLNRFYLKGKNTGTVVASMSSDLSARDIGQIKTASKDIAKRELYFARAVLFVEDESQQRFIEGCAKKLDLGLDSAGLSIVEVGGQDGFEPYIKLAKQLDMPFLCLRDLPWGSDTERPSKIYRSLGCELEQYLKHAGCGSLMEQARKTVGTSKQWVAKYCGEHIERVNIPPFLTQLLEDAMKLCEKRRKK
jgi:hypothetical protein